MAFSFKLDFNNVGKFDPANPTFGIAPFVPVVATITQANVMSDYSIAVNLNCDGQDVVIYLDVARRDNGQTTATMQNKLTDFVWACGGSANALDAVRGAYKYYDKDSQTMAEREGEVFPELMNKQIGVIMTRDYWLDKNKGQVASAVRLFQCFQPTTNKLPTDHLRGVEGSEEKLLEVAELARTESEKARERVNNEAQALASVTPTFGSVGSVPTFGAGATPSTADDKKADADIPF